MEIISTRKAVTPLAPGGSLRWGFAYMSRSILLATVATAAMVASIASAAAQPASSAAAAEALSAARNGIQTQLGASTYTVTSKDIEAAPGGDNSLLNSVILQMPDVAQDSYGQFHVRGEHNQLQYRINGIILPEGISVFGLGGEIQAR